MQRGADDHPEHLTDRTAGQAMNGGAEREAIQGWPIGTLCCVIHLPTTEKVARPLFVLHFPTRYLDILLRERQKRKH